MKNYPISFTNIDNSLEFYDEVLKVKSEAYEYINSFKWCEKIVDSQLYFNLGSAFCVFIIDIVNNQSKDKADNKLWVIVGDLPSMYLDSHNVKSLKDSLEVYVELAEEWVENVIAKKSVKECFPFHKKPSMKLAKFLNNRIGFISTEILENLDDIVLDD